MKKLFTTLFFAAITAIATAVPAKRGQWKTVTLADGTTVRVELRGDEFCHFWQAEDGRTFVKDSQKGYYKTVDVKTLMDKAQARQAKVKALTEARRAQTRTGADRQTGGSPYVGDKKGLVILVDFDDMPFTHGSRERYQQILNGENYSNPLLGFVGSVSDYYRDQSHGQFNLTFDIAGPVRMPRGYAYYGGNGNEGQGGDVNKGEMFQYALNAVDSEVDFRDYDWNGDGEVEQVYFIFAGLGEANGGDEGTIWPHKWQLLGAIGRTMQLDGVTIDVYACSAECQPAIGSGATTTTHIDGIGTICHEFSHCLGLPDMYDTDYAGSGGEGYGMGAWDLMSSGSYNGNGFHPACYTGAERMWIGWESPIELTQPTDVSGMESIAEGGDFYLIRNDGYADEYYILENRQRTGRWDVAIPGDGLLITHVDYDEMSWQRYNNPNVNPSHQRCSPIPADGSLYDDNPAGDVWPYNGIMSLTNTSRPAATVFNRNTDGSLYMNKSVTGITQQQDGTISFSFNIGAPVYMFNETFDKCEGQGGNDGNFSGLAMATPTYDNDGWTGETPRAGYLCARFGTSRAAGWATTPSITLSGEHKLSFMAAPYTGGGTSLTVEVAEGNATLQQSTFTMKNGGWTNFETTINGSGPVKLTFKTNSGMFYLDEVIVNEAEGSTGIDNITVSPSTDNDRRIYSVDGRYVGTDDTKLGKGLYIRNGKKFIKR